MPVVSFLNQKGGVGKTTIAVNVARYFTINNSRTILVDADPQASARDWHNASDGNLMQVIGMDRPTIDKDIKILQNYDWIFIDGAPRLEQLTASVINCSDIILIPTTPSQYDVWATSELITLLKKHMTCNDNLKCAFIVSRQMPNTKVGKEFREEIKGFDLPVFSCGTFSRIIYSNCISEGKTVLDDISDKKATQEIVDICTTIEEFAYGTYDFAKASSQ